MRRSLSVTDDESNDVYTGVRFGIILVGSRNAVPSTNILFGFRFLLVRG